MINQVGGTLNIGSQFQGANQTGGSSFVTNSGGTMNIGGGTGQFYVASRGPGVLTLTAASTYIGGTVVSNGTLAVNGSLGVTAVTVTNNATLVGTGSLGSNVTVNVGGTLSPGAVGTLGTLTVASNVTLNGTAVMDINATTLTNDVLKAGSITYGGTLLVTNIAGTPAVGNSFKLFSAASYTGAFTGIVPATPGAGLAWDTSTLNTDGILHIIVGTNTSPINIIASVSGNTLTLTWPAGQIGWTLQAQTNSLGAGLNPGAGAWFNVPGSTNVNSVNLTVDPAPDTVFYRLKQ